MNTFQMPDIPDDDVQPLRPDIKWAMTMLGLIFGILILTYVLFYGFSYFVISNLSIEQEKKYFWDTITLWKEVPFDFKKLHYDIKKPYYIDVVITESKEVNAFATIWWKVIFTSEILKRLENEEEFLFILWHEISHIKNRDPIKAYSFQIPFYITLMFLWIDVWLDIDQVQKISSSYFSRKTELQSDKWWIRLVKENNWDIRCILPFFEESSQIFEEYLIYISSHPANESRIKQIKDEVQNIKSKEDCIKWKYK